MNSRLPARLAVLLLALVLFVPILPAATYAPMPDASLMARAPIIVRAQVVARTVRQETYQGASMNFTIVTLQRLELLKGTIGETFAVRVAGGRLGDTVWMIPGTPAFPAGQQVVLFLDAAPGHPGEYRLTEFGLSKFDLVTDAAGRRFAVRPVFGLDADLTVSARPEASAQSPGSPALARDADSFLEALRSYSRGEPVPEIALGQPAASASDSTNPEFINIVGREPGDPDSCGTGVPCLTRWFWDTGASPNGVLTVTGTQSNLKGGTEPHCGTDSICDVTNTVTAWTGVPGTSVKYSGPTTGGNIAVGLDATSSYDGGSAWNAALDCPIQGVIGLGGPGGSSVFTPFKGDTDYVVASSGQVSIRKVTCSDGYDARIYRAVLLHEVGHTLGYGHPDQGQSIHSTTTSADWTNAVMHSTIPPSLPDTPQTDDIAATTYYYGTAAPGAAPTAAFSFAPTSPLSGSPVTFTNTSTGSPTAYTWDFGDASTYSTDTSPMHIFASPGSFTVTLYAGSANGTGSASQQVIVGNGGGGGGACSTADGKTLCLSGGRFKVTANWTRPDNSNGAGTAVTLTDNTGYFWFFSASNVEVVTKVLPFCANPFNSIWVFAGGLTNVQVDLTYTDTKTGTVVHKMNPQSTAFQPIQDTSAFKTCP